MRNGRDGVESEIKKLVYLFGISLFAVVFEYFRCHESRRAGESLSSGWEHASANTVVGKFEMDLRVLVAMMMLLVIGPWKTPHEHVVGLQIAVDDSIRV